MTDPNSVHCADCRWCHVETGERVHCHKEQWNNNVKRLDTVGMLRRPKGCEHFDSMDD